MAWTSLEPIGARSRATAVHLQEARAIAHVDVLWQQEEILLQHLVATHGYLLGVSQCEQARHPDD